MKRIGLVSLCADWTREVVDEIGAQYVVFNEIAEDYCQTHKVKYLVKDIFLPVVKTLVSPIVLLDMQSLMHDDFVVAIKKEYDLYWLQGEGFKLSGAERALHDEYKKRLEQICDLKGDTTWLKKQLTRCGY